MSTRNLTWAELRALHELYVKGETKLRILDNAFIKRLKREKKLIDFKFGNKNILVSRFGYSQFYEDNLKSEFLKFAAFLEESGLENDGRRNYDEYDITTLIFINANKDEFRSNLTTIRQFSSLVFKEKGSKYLENKLSLKRAVCQILEIDDFPDRDPKMHQWRLVTDCLQPMAVILCENMAHLKNADKARENNIELWYVGGNNTSIIEFIPAQKLTLPLYYSGDWDLAGLQIYLRVKEILSQKGVVISLLFPYDTNNSLSVRSPHHNSEWDLSKPLSGLPASHFLEREKNLIQILIQKSHWIEEESLDLITNFVFNHYQQPDSVKIK